MFVLSIDPIDYGWELLKTVNQTRALIERLSGDDNISLPIGLITFESLWEEAQNLALAKGWEGDFRCPPVVFWFPTEECFEPGFVIKQDNNGHTFVCSPEPLFWGYKTCKPPRQH